MLEQALCDENEYSRLEKIRIGCKYISQQLPFSTTFNDSQTLKYLICCYPFSSTNVELLVTAFFDRFKDIDFFNSYFQAASEISQFPEQKVLLSNFRSLKQASQRKLSLKLFTQTQIYAKDVIQNLLFVKKFSSSYLFQLFQLGFELEVNLEEHAKIFLKYLKNTMDEQFITQLIDIFQDVKQNILRNTLWSIALEDEIEQYFYATQLPSTMTRIDIPGKSSDSEEDESEVDMHEIIEKWICRDQNGVILEQAEYFRNDQYFEFIMKFIFDPLHSPPIAEWAEYMENYQDINDYRAWKQDFKQLDKAYQVRSSKLLKIITRDKNFSIISKKVPQLLMKIFYLAYECLGDSEKSINLYHLGYIIDYLLTQSPKSCLYYIVDLNLLFSLCQFIYNPQIVQILEKLLNMIDDEYQLGMHVQEYLWFYIQSTELFGFITLIMTNQTVDKTKQERTFKPEQTYHILPLLKAQSNFDKLPRMQEINLNQKKFLTDLLGQMTPGKSPNEFYGMSQNNWHLYDEIQENITNEEFNFKDLDNLKDFSQHRNKQHFKFSPTYSEQKFKRQRTIALQQHCSVSPSNIALGTKKSAVDCLALESKTSQHVTKVQRQTSATKQKKWINTNGQQTYLRQGTLQKQQQFLSNTSIRLRTFGSDKSDFSSNDGFSSSKLRTIYPSIKMQQETTFERELQYIKKNEHVSSPCSQLIKGLVQSAFHYCWRKTNTLGLYKAQYKLNTDIMFVVLLNKHCIERYFQIYLSSIHCSQDGELSSADECGMILNEIYSNYPRLKQQNQIITNLKECFLNVSDFFCKTIILLNKQQHKMDHQQLNFKQYIMTQTLTYGLQMFECNKSQSLSRNPYLHLNETVLHILIIWYFDSLSHNLQQTQFVNLFIIIMIRAPVHILMHLIFKLGLITSLYNFSYKQSQNGMIGTIGVESFYLHLTYIVHVINEAIKQRNLQALSESLNQLQSWQQLLLILPDPTSKAVLILNQRMKCATIYIPTSVVTQFHTMKSLDSDQLFKPKLVLDHLKQKYYIQLQRLNIIPKETGKKGNKFLQCVQEKMDIQRKLSQKKK